MMWWCKHKWSIKDERRFKITVPPDPGEELLGDSPRKTVGEHVHIMLQCEHCGDVRFRDSTITIPS